MTKTTSDVVPKSPMRHVLLIDDDEQVRRILDRLMVRAGYLVSPFEDAETAISVLPFVSFDIVVSDVQMPVQDGYRTGARQARGE